LALCKCLKARGLKVAAAKFTSHGFDRENTDTSRLLEVCDAVAGISDAETAIFWNGKRFLPDITPLMNADVLVVEGGKTLHWLPRVLLLNDPSEAAELSNGLALATFGEVKAEGLKAITDIEDLADLVQKRGFALPGLDCGACGREDCHGLASEIVAGEAKVSDCSASAAEVNISVNGTRLALNPFVEGIITGAVRGMLTSLKGYVPGSSIDLHIG
jgi:molybdopterin-guanine dinucleotide biosynthesis protein B